jgi:hypothetical protein
MPIRIAEKNLVDSPVSNEAPFVTYPVLLERLLHGIHIRHGKSHVAFPVLIESGGSGAEASSGHVIQVLNRQRNRHSQILPPGK